MSSLHIFGVGIDPSVMTWLIPTTPMFQVTCCMSMINSYHAAKSVARASWRSALAWFSPLEDSNLHVVPPSAAADAAAGADVEVVVRSLRVEPSGAAAVSAAAGDAAVSDFSRADERRRHVKPNGALSILPADSRVLMLSKKQSLVSSLVIPRLLSVLSKSSLKSS